MGLRKELVRFATGRAHVLVVEAPGRWRSRAAVERHVRERGWILSRSPADADVLAVCGPVGPGIAEPVEEVWHQMPGPRVRIDIDHEDQAGAALAQAAESLADTAGHLEDAATRVSGPDLLGAGRSTVDEHAHTEHSEAHGEHGGGHHETGHNMAMAPEGVALAEGEDDRDGLEMDVLHARLGPVLPHWPAGLVLRCSLHGDVISEAEGELLGGQPGSPAEDPAPVARRCDAIASLLALAGWHDAADQARRVRDRLLSARVDDRAVADLRRLRRRVARSWLLRWSLRGVRPVHEHEHELEQHRLPRHISGDVYDRLLSMVERAHQDLVMDVTSTPSSSGGGPEVAGSSGPVSVDAIPELVHGLDLATARLVIASLGLDVLHAGRQVSHG